MESSAYRKRWLKIKNEPDYNLVLNETTSLSRQIAYSFLDYYLKDCHYKKEYIDLLCEISTFSDDPAIQAPGAKALFGIIIESLCDDFEELQTETYNKVMSQIITFCRNLKEGRLLDQSLKDFGINTYDDLIRRINSVRNNDNLLLKKTTVKKILLLSRVTIGADVAITSVVIQRLLKIFPDAELILIGSNKLEEIYSENNKIKIRKVFYSRKGGLFERLSSWLSVLKIIKQETKIYPLENIVLIDPDSRLSQLGVLPLIPDNNYFFFDSRSGFSLKQKMSMAELTNFWLTKITRDKNFCYPGVWIPNRHLDYCACFFDKLRKNGTKKIMIRF